MCVNEFHWSDWTLDHLTSSLNSKYWDFTIRWLGWQNRENIYSVRLSKTNRSVSLLSQTSDALVMHVTIIEIENSLVSAFLFCNVMKVENVQCATFNSLFFCLIKSITQVFEVHFIVLWLQGWQKRMCESGHTCLGLFFPTVHLCSVLYEYKRPVHTTAITIMAQKSH